MISIFDAHVSEETTRSFSNKEPSHVGSLGNFIDLHNPEKDDGDVSTRASTN